MSPRTGKSEWSTHYKRYDAITVLRNCVEKCYHRIIISIDRLIQLCYFKCALETQDTSLFEYADHQLIVWLIAYLVEENFSLKIDTFFSTHFSSILLYKMAKPCFIIYLIVILIFCFSRVSFALDIFPNVPIFNEKFSSTKYAINQTINWWSAYSNKLVSWVSSAHLK